MLITLTLVTISYCIDIENHDAIYLKYTHDLFVSYTSINPERKQNISPCRQVNSYMTCGLHADHDLFFMKICIMDLKLS